MLQKLLVKILKKKTIIVYESTVYPGTTEQICIPLLEKNSGLKEGFDFYVGYSPERINPGDKFHTVNNIIKVVSAKNKKISLKIKNLYQSIVKPKIFVASSILVAETSKIIENVQRDINIALINELSLICKKLKINTREVLKASETKWNFLKFRPGLVGGHCIGVDPYYLSFLSKKIGHNPILIDSGRKINDGMTNYVCKNIIANLPKKNSKILIMGVSFKKNCDDIRNSKIIELAHLLRKKSCNIYLHDPLVKLAVNKSEVIIKKNINISEIKKNKFNAVIIGAGHDMFLKYNNSFYKKILHKNAILFDLDYFFTPKIKKDLEFKIWNL